VKTQKILPPCQRRYPRLLFIEHSRVLNDSGYRHFACVLYNGHIIGFINQGQQHAEFRLVRELKRRRLTFREISNLTVYIFRGKKNPKTNQNELGMSRPCKMCTSILLRYGISRIIYTNRDGIPVLEKL